MPLPLSSDSSGPSALHPQGECFQMERRAQEFLMAGETESAYETYQSAARCFRTAGKWQEAALCFTQAASCWKKHTSQHPLRKAAEAYEEAAREFFSNKDYGHARLRFKDAALLYEKEGDAEKYAFCFYQSKQAQARMEWKYFLNGVDVVRGVKIGWFGRFVAFFRCAAGILNWLVWGYGERPFRTFFAGLFLILACAFFYAGFGLVWVNGAARGINFGESLYFSIVTYTTVGYGDYMPADFLTRVFAGGEALSGILLTPIFVVGLTRRYLRMPH